MDGDRKSIEPMAQRIDGADVQSLRQFVGQSPWPVEQIQECLAQKVADLMSEPEVWMIDETSFPKAGDASVGVARQYCGALGKVANCQVTVSLHWSTVQMSCPVGWRLYLPESWINDPSRRAQCKIPNEVSYRSKNQLALDLIDQVICWKLAPLPVVADSAYGNDFEFRAGLRSRKLEYAVAVEPGTKVWTETPGRIALAKSKPTGRPGPDRLLAFSTGRWEDRTQTDGQDSPRPMARDYRELKEELGLDHYEGRHWLGWHHHVTLVSLASAFLRTEQARTKKLLVRRCRRCRRFGPGFRFG